MFKTKTLILINNKLNSDTIHIPQSEILSIFVAKCIRLVVSNLYQYTY